MRVVLRVCGFALLTSCLVTAAACGGDSGPKTIFPEKPECSTVPITPRMGQHPMVISHLEIGSLDDGFDLDGDGMPDNKLGGIAGVANDPIDQSLKDFSIVIPLEFFDFPENVADSCVKFAFYLGQYKLDEDGDGDDTANDRADCNDHDQAIKRDAAEVPDNGKDDDCDGRADETVVTTDGGTMEVASTDTMDRDSDGVTIADGDCDDTEPAVKGASIDEVCGDGLDNDCDGNADYGVDAAMNPDCTPFDDTPDELALDPLSFNPDGSPVIVFRSGATEPGTGGMLLTAGPSLFSVKVPVIDEISLDLRITGAQIEATVVPVGGDLGIVMGRLGGVMDGHTLDQIRGLDIQDFVRPEDSLLDAIFANVVGALLALPSNEMGCKMPDIDVDLDGLEAFCDTNLDDEVNAVDLCIDGDGKEYRDVVDAQGVVTKHCTEELWPDGTPKFADGISIALTFETVPTILAP